MIFLEIVGKCHHKCRFTGYGSDTHLILSMGAPRAIAGARLRAVCVQHRKLSEWIPEYVMIQAAPAKHKQLVIDSEIHITNIDPAAALLIDWTVDGAYIPICI